MFVYFWKRERQRPSGEEIRERGKHRIWGGLQALSCQHRASHGTWTHELWDHDLSQSQTHSTKWATQAPLLMVICNFSFLLIFIDQNPFIRNHCIFLPSSYLSVSMIYLYQYVFMHIYYILWDLIQYCQCFTVLITYILLLEASSCWPLFAINMAHQFLSSSLLAGTRDSWGWLCIFSASDLESAFSPGAPDCFYWKWYLESKILAILIALECHCF